MDSNPINEQTPSRVRGRSHITLNAPVAGTYRFGEISPHLLAYLVPDDENVTFHSGTYIRSLNLQSPLLQDVKVIKEYYQVPKSAILPLNWEKIQDQPSIGDDVNSLSIGTVVPNFMTKVKSVSDRWLLYIEELHTVEEGETPPYALIFEAFMKYLFWLKSLFSTGSLISQLGTNYWECILLYSPDGSWQQFDKAFDDWQRLFIAAVATGNESDKSFYVHFGTDVYEVFPTLLEDNLPLYDGGSCVPISWRRFLELIKDDTNWYLATGGSFPTEVDFATEIEAIFTDLGESFDSDFVDWSGAGALMISNSKVSRFNLDKLFAYQMVCAHFQTNDKVDYVYSADLYRQNVLSAWLPFVSLDGETYESQSFTWNGLTLLPDILSSKMFGTVIDCFGVISGVDDINDFLNYWNLIFNVRNSLRFGDYFTGSRTRPLAAGNGSTSVPVSGGRVDVLDFVYGKAVTKFKDAVNKAKRKAYDYMKDIMGVKQNRDYHNPWFIVRTEDYLSAIETDATNVLPQKDSGTSSMQNTIISNIKGSSNNTAFRIDCDCNSILLGIMFFDICRLYSKGVDRFNFLSDRYEMFNSYMQFIGDQEINGVELDGRNAIGNFGYTLRHMEYKEAIARAFGGLAIPGNLPGWAFIADDRLHDSVAGLSPSFIRSYPFEFDRFYLSLPGMSDGTYYHFVVKHENNLELDRPMVKKPSIE